MQRGYVLPSGSIVHEVIDGEAIIMDMRTGSYYSTDGIGALVWSAALADAPHQLIVDAAEHAFPGVDAGGHAARFLDALVEAGLLRAEDREGTGAAPDFATAGGWHPPALACHSDMQDLLLLDPIHDVDETGWPMPRDAVVAEAGSA
jgi:hypothetical protein